MRLLLDQFCSDNNFVISERFGQLGRPETRRPLPFGYTDKFYADILRALGISKDGQVWLHQSEALEAISSGLNAVLSTGTASGKSLIFQLAAIRKLKSYGDEARVLAFYPTRALNNDQTNSWRKILKVAGYPKSSLGIIDGSIPVAERMAHLEAARVLLMTPDTVHAWLMSNLDAAPVREFIAGLSLQVLDEAHFYDGTFGTNMSYLLRRILFAQKALNPDFRSGEHDQTIMATATLSNPGRFAFQLTGRDAWTIDETQDASPRHPRHFTVIRTPDFGRRRAVKKFLRLLGDTPLEGSVLTFVDSRTGVDEITQDVNGMLKNESFAAYRSGLTGNDRVEIEKRLRSTGAAPRKDDFKGVVTTSALEAGIDISGIKTVVLEGVPVESSSFNQRVGRLRQGGHIILFEEDNKLRAMQGNVEDHLLSRPRQPIFYRVNPKIQAEQAICLIDEMEQLGVKSPTRNRMAWPPGFTETVKAYKQAPNELTEVQRQAIPPANMDPHYYYGLRTLDGPTRRLMLFNPELEKTVSIGEVTQGQALAEALPGMTVYANGRKYRVKSWGRNKNSLIMVRPLTGEEFDARIRTRAMVSMEVYCHLNNMSVIRNRLRKNGDANFMADCRLVVEKTARGFIERAGKESKKIIFDMKQQDDLEMDRGTKYSSTVLTPKFGAQPKSRLDTSGVVIRVGESVIKDRVLRRLAKLMKQALCEVANISPSDIGVMNRNVRIGTSARSMLTDRAIVIYDRTPGSLFFSSKIYTNTDRIIEAMADLVDPNDSELADAVNKFAAWYDRLKPVKAPIYDEWLREGLKISAARHQREAYAPHSQVIMKRGDVEEWVEIVGAEVTHNTFVYKVRRVNRGLNLRPIKNAAGRPASKHRTSDYLMPMFAKASQLVRPHMPTYRYGIFNTHTNRYEEDPRAWVVDGVAQKRKEPAVQNG